MGRNLRIFVSLLTLLGAGASLYLVYLHAQDSAASALNLESPTALCNIGAGFDCIAVARSAYSDLFGFPLAAWGLGSYLSLLVATVVSGAAVGFGSVVLLFGLASSLFSVYLAYVSHFIIGQWCLVCIGLYVVNAGLLMAGLLGRKGQPLVSGTIAWFVGPSRTFATRVSRLFVCAAVPALLLGGALFESEEIAFKERVSLRAQQSKLSHALKSWKSAVSQDVSLNLLANDPLADRVYGNPNAKVTLVEFSDFQCPACREVSKVVEAVLPEYTDRVRFVLKHFPIDNSCNPLIPREGHILACPAAELVQCAGEQGKFYDVAWFLFAYAPMDLPQTGKEVDDAVGLVTSQFALDAAKLSECLTSDRQLAKIRTDAALADTLGLEGTPTFWLNGKKAMFRSAADLRELLNAALESSR